MTSWGAHPVTSGCWCLMTVSGTCPVITCSSGESADNTVTIQNMLHTVYVFLHHFLKSWIFCFWFFVFLPRKTKQCLFAFPRHWLHMFTGCYQFNQRQIFLPCFVPKEVKLTCNLRRKKSKDWRKVWKKLCFFNFSLLFISWPLKLFSIPRLGTSVQH